MCTFVPPLTRTTYICGACDVLPVPNQLTISPVPAGTLHTDASQAPVGLACNVMNGRLIRRGRVEFECDNCGITTSRRLRDYKRAKRKFCGHACWSSWAAANSYISGGRAIQGKSIGLSRAPKNVLVNRIGSMYAKDDSTGCWAWIGLFDKNGYGRFWDGRSHQRAHRAAYELLVEPIPDGLVIDHLCRNTTCVNPSHLEPVTVRENTLRGLGPASINAKKTHCGRGHEFSVENTHIDTKGKRVCKTCQKNKKR